MARIPGIPADSDLNVSQNATSWAGKVANWLRIIADAFGTAAFKDAAAVARSASDGDLLEKQAFGEGAFRDVGGTTTTNLATIGDIQNAGGVSVGDSPAQVPSNTRVNTLITQAFGNSANKSNNILYENSNGRAINGTSNSNRSNVTLTQSRDLDAYNYITLCISGVVGTRRVFFSKVIIEAAIQDASDNWVQIDDSGHLLGFRRNNAGTQIGFWSVGSTVTAIRLHAIIGSRW